MSCLQIVDEAAPLFDYGTWNLRLSHLARQYGASHPVPHVLLTDFLASQAASQAAYEFPRRAARTGRTTSIATRINWGWRSESCSPAHCGPLPTN